MARYMNIAQVSVTIPLVPEAVGYVEDAERYRMGGFESDYGRFIHNLVTGYFVSGHALEEL